MSVMGQIERTGRKRRQKRLILVLSTLGALGLGGLVMYVLAQTSATSSRSAASAPDPDPAPQGPVTWEAADRAVSEAEALQTLVSDLGTAVVEAGVHDMAPLEDLMARTVEVASAANDMLEAVDLGADESAHSARDRFHASARASRTSVEVVLQQLRAAGVDVQPLVETASAR
jgi:hypothetical protein